MSKEALQIRDAQATGRQATQAPLGMPKTDHAEFVDLLFQQVAQSAKTAVATTESKALLVAAKDADARARAALAACAMPDMPPIPKQLFRSIDGAFMGLFELYLHLGRHKDTSILPYGDELKATMRAIDDRFRPLGWKIPTTADEGRARAKSAAVAGLATVTPTEKGKLGRLHLRAARQQFLDGWDAIAEGKLESMTPAAHHLGSATVLLLDPRAGDQRSSIAAELAAVEEVFGRVATAIQHRDESSVGALRQHAKHLDALLPLVGREPKWVARIGVKPTVQTAPQQTPTQAPTPSATNRQSNVRNPEFKYTRYVHIYDKGYGIRGRIEIQIEGHVSPSQGVVITTSDAIPNFFGPRTQAYFEIQYSVARIPSQDHSEVRFGFTLLGPTRTASETSSEGGRTSISTSDKQLTHERNSQDGKTTGSSGRSRATFQRIYRIAKLANPVDSVQFDPQKPAQPYEPKVVQTHTALEEARGTEATLDAEAEGITWNLSTVDD